MGESYQELEKKKLVFKMKIIDSELFKDEIMS